MADWPVSIFFVVPVLCSILKLNRLRPIVLSRLTSATETRMVQLPAIAAIEYVAACCRTRTKTKTVRGAYARSPKFNAYTNRLGFLCLVS